VALGETRILATVSDVGGAYDAPVKRAGVVILAVAMAACTAETITVTTLAPTSTTASITTVASTSTTAGSPTTSEILESLGGEPCPDSDFTCVTLDLPLDHFDPADERTIAVTFAVRPATGESRGAFVTATGGPGTSGIAVADSYTSLYDPPITEEFDVVFFDQRGIASSGGLDCPQAAIDYFRAPGDIATAAGLNLLVEAAETFSTTCVEEMGNPEELAYVSTAQAVEDLEAFRQTFGFEEFVLFGESYGTQLGQTYAAVYGEHLDRLIIDGVVDLTLDGIAYHQQLAAASSRTLDLMLEACDQDETCAADLGMAAGAAYDRLYALLLEGPMTIEFPLPDGTNATRAFGLADLEMVATGHLYEEYDRMMFLRALAAQSGRGDLIPLLRLLYVNLVVDPMTEEPIEDPSWSDAMYYGVECLDYAYPGDTPEDVVQAMIDSAPDDGALRLGSVYYGDLPCAFWPHTTTEGRPAPLTAEGIPVLVLGSTVDPVTPYHQGVDVHSRLADGYIMSKEGGPHVIYGWGEICPDVEVTAFILDGTPPVTEVCDGEVIGVYQPLFSASPGEDPEILLDTIEWEVYYLPEYYYWDGFTDSGAGCPAGGTVAFTASDAGDEFVFEDCALSPEVVISGTGAYDWENDVFTLDVGIGDCAYAYERAGAGYSVEPQC
jgi:pimeloyl-ACP methyl ester carboxylesterase